MIFEGYEQPSPENRFLAFFQVNILGFDFSDTQVVQVFSYFGHTGQSSLFPGQRAGAVWS